MSDSSQWLTTSEAAKVLGVLPRAIQKRAVRGSLVARRNGGKWEIDVDAVDASNGRQTDAVDASMMDAVDASDVQSVDVVDGANGRNGRGQVDVMDASIIPTGQREIETELRDQLAREREQNQFLRGLVEQRDRDAAELRASLREALRAMPRQLTAPPEAAQIASANVAPEAVKSPAKREGAALSYGEIADELERGLNR